MEKIGSRHILSCIILAVLSIACYAASPYPDMVAADNARIGHIADLQHCFDADGLPLFDDLYIYGRIWQERQDTNHYVLPQKIVWQVEPIIRCSLMVQQSIVSVHYRPVIDRFGNTTCEAVRADSVLSDSTRYIYQIYSDTLPDTLITPLSQSDTCSCRWTTTQGFVIREYHDYEYLATTYKWIGTPDTLTDTIGCTVLRINKQVFNPRIEGTKHKPMGELRYIDGATEWISPTDTAFVAHAPGGGQAVARMRWAVDNMLDTFYWDSRYKKDTTRMLFRFSRPEGGYYTYSAATAAVNARNKALQTQNIMTHADVLHYTQQGNTYILTQRWDGRQHGIEAITAANRKIYLTGRLVPASIINMSSNGSTSKTAFTGAVSGHGDGPAALHIYNRGHNDIYIENLQLGTRSLTVEADEPTSMFDKVPRRYLSAAITLEGNGQDTHLHFRGTNYLCGNSGKATISTLHSAAIYLNVGENDYLSLTLDDIWADGTHTNGLLKMEGSPDEQIGNTESTYHCTASPIYSGNNRTSITFNGGNYHLAPADNTTSTINFMIVSRRMYRTPMVDYIFADVGSDVGDGLVYIKSGNFRMSTPLLSQLKNTPVMLADGTQYEHDYYTMYMPLRTYITGGSFENCRVLTTDGDATAPDCTGLISCPTNGEASLFQYYIPYSNVGNRLIPLWSSQPDAIAANYNLTGITPLHNKQTNEYYFMPYLPSNGQLQCDESGDADKQNWDIMIPRGISADVSSVDRPLYMTVKRSNGVNLTGTNYFAMLDVNPYYPTERDITLTNLTETSDYTIDKRVYLVTWTMANRWRVFTMPFDVTDISLMLTWATDSMGYTADPDLEWEYYQKTMQTILLKGRLTELSTEKGMNLPFWSLYQRAVTTQTPKPDSQSSSSTYFPQVARAVQQLHFHGEADTLQGAFYLFEAAETPIPYNSYCQAWRIPQRDSAGVIMHKGRTYAILFRNSANNNFWNGKYIVLEGPGQTIQAVPQADMTLTASDILISGNNTFQAYRNAPDQRYDFNYLTQRFERYEHTSSGWTNAYIVASNDAWNAQNRFDMQCLLDVDALDEIIVDIPITIRTAHNELRLSTLSDQQVTLYSATGQQIMCAMIHSGETKTLSLGQGVYILATPTQRKKILIK